MLTDPLGSYIGVAESIPPVSIPEPFTFAMGQSIDVRGKCYADYVETPCSVVQQWLNSGVGEHAPWDNTDTRWVKNANNGKGGYVLHVYGVENGYYGFRPTSTSNWAHPKLQQRGSMADTAGEEESAEGESQTPVQLPIARAIKPIIPSTPPGGTQTLGPPCGDIIAALFGGEGALAKTNRWRDNSGNYYEGEWRDAEAGNSFWGEDGYASPAHIYIPTDIVGGDVGAFVPYGYTDKIITVQEGPNGNYVQFNYNGYGNYRTPFTLSVFHVKDVSWNRGDVLAINKNTRNAAGSVRIGNIGGPGGSAKESSEVHIHITARNPKTKKRISLGKIFC